MTRSYLLIHGFLLVLFVFLASSLFYTRTLLSKDIVSTQPRLDPLWAWNPASYPLLTSPLEIGSISSQAVVVMDRESGVFLLGNNQHAILPMASTTKLMSALVALENFKELDVLTVFTPFVEGVRIGFQKGERVRFIDMLYGMLLPSGNDAALAIAQNYPGGEDAFIKRMNAKAKELLLTTTHFADSTGLDDAGNYTTATELARLAGIALQDPTIKTIVETKEKTITNLEGDKTYHLKNLNRLLGEDGVTGVKTGFTDGAGGVLITSRKKNGHTLLIVVMKSKDRFLDTQRILTQLDTAVSYKDFILR